MKTLINNLPRKFKMESGKKWGIAGGILLIAVIIGIVIAVVLKPKTSKAPTTENFATTPAVTENFTALTESNASDAAASATTAAASAKAAVHSESLVLADLDTVNNLNYNSLTADQIAKLKFLINIAKVADTNDSETMTIIGNVIGNVTGKVTGKVTAGKDGVAVKGPVKGNVTGKVTTGKVTTGKEEPYAVIGNVTGSVLIPKEGSLTFEDNGEWLYGNNTMLTFTHGEGGSKGCRKYYAQIFSTAKPPVAISGPPTQLDY